MSVSESVAAIIIDQLVQLGIVDFFLAPGYRSTSLVFAVENHPRTNSSISFDERSLGFLALGFAKSKNAPVAIITTSGSALANLYPAVLEAYQNHIPLILLTADRPFEMLNCGQNQTIDQLNFFSPYTCHNLHLPAFDKPIDFDYLSSSLSNAIFQGIKCKAPVHINCPLRKPFLSNKPSFIESKKPITLHTSKKIPSLVSLEKISEQCRNKKGLIILGNLPHSTNLTPILALAKKLGWPIFADAQSPISKYKKTEEVICYFELILQSKISFEVDYIMQFGDQFVSAALLQWIKAQTAEHIHISCHSSFFDPIRKISQKIETDPSFFAQKLCEHISLSTNPLLPFLKEKELFITESLKSYFSKKQYFSERYVLYHLPSFLKPNANLFIANSTPVRNFLEVFSSNSPLNVFTNRGVSGIDGNISTTIGIHLAGQDQTIGIIGDQAALHDLNAFAKAKEKNLHLIIFNNKGGGIFSKLPLQKHVKIFEKAFQAKHDFNFSKIAEQFSLSYTNISNFHELENFTPDSLPTILEFTTSNKTNLLCEKELLDQFVEKQLC